MARTLDNDNTLPRVAIETHGCKLNRADSEVLSRQFAEAGYELVSMDEPADVYVVNSCTVTHVADKKARQSLSAASRSNPNAVIVATGCYAQRAPDILKKMEQVDLVIGNRGKSDLVRQVAAITVPDTVPCAVGTDTTAGASNGRLSNTRAMIKIQEGCNQVCAYCIVPTVRGRERSVPPEQIVDQINARAAEGYKEVVLTGTQLGSYGFDIPGITLELLINKILERTDIPRLRVSSLQPQEITSNLMSLWTNQRLCPHFHIPLQSGSRNILKHMRRRYTPDLYEQKVGEIRRYITDVSITTDVLIGFPGETDGDFQDTYDLCERVGFSSMHVFPYSSRPGTSAFHFTNKVNDRAKADRTQKMLRLARKLSHNHKRGLLGSVRPVLWEKVKLLNGTTVWSGLTDNYIRVYTKGNHVRANDITQARLERQDGVLVYCQVLDVAA